MFRLHLKKELSGSSAALEVVSWSSQSSSAPHNIPHNMVRASKVQVSRSECEGGGGKKA